jgi:hypothetical protein
VVEEEFEDDEGFDPEDYPDEEHSVSEGVKD